MTKINMERVARKVGSGHSFEDTVKFWAAMTPKAYLDQILKHGDENTEWLESVKHNVRFIYESMSPEHVSLMVDEAVWRFIEIVAESPPVPADDVVVQAVVAMGQVLGPVYFDWILGCAENRVGHLEFEVAFRSTCRLFPNPVIITPFDFAMIHYDKHTHKHPPNMTALNALEYLSNVATSNIYSFKFTPKKIAEGCMTIVDWIFGTSFTDEFEVDVEIVSFLIDMLEPSNAPIWMKGYRVQLYALHSFNRFSLDDKRNVSMIVQDYIQSAKKCLHDHLAESAIN